MASRASHRGLRRGRAPRRSRVQAVTAAATGAAAIAVATWLAIGCAEPPSRSDNRRAPTTAAAPFGGLDPPATAEASPSGPFGGTGDSEPDAQPVTEVAAQPAAADVADLLSALEVAEPVWDGYDRALFEHWTLDEASGCDTRRLVLIAQAVQPPVVDAGCRLYEGVWISPYDGLSFAGYGAGIEIDHLVPLAEAWRSGAWAWPPELRRAFANDTAGLVAVSAASNQDKLASGPEEWLPPDVEAHCWYATNWVAVKHRWVLSIDITERDALTAILADCAPAAPAPRADP